MTSVFFGVGAHVWAMVCSVALVYGATGVTLYFTRKPDQKARQRPSNPFSLHSA